MQTELHETILLGEGNAMLNYVIDLVNARKKTNMPYRDGGLFEQPYFMMVYVEPWVDQAYQEIRDMKANIGDAEPDENQPYHQLVAALNTKLLFD